MSKKNKAKAYSLDNENDVLKLAKKIMHYRASQAGAHGVTERERPVNWFDGNHRAQPLEDTDMLQEYGRKYGLFKYRINDVQFKHHTEPGFWFETNEGERNTVEMNGSPVPGADFYDTNPEKTKTRWLSTENHGFDTREVWNLDTSMSVTLYLRFKMFSYDDPFDRDNTYKKAFENIILGLETGMTLLDENFSDDTLTPLAQELAQAGATIDGHAPDSNDFETVIMSAYAQTFKNIGYVLPGLWT